ncbi:MAG: hypothetical protein N2745_06435 [Syntrophorhabdaceae bacterium]|nr:hypothetical protein [Syntrophorhabdaceae bacterium]
MALIEELKKKTEEGFKTIKETAQDFAFNVEKHAKIGKKKFVDITKLKREIQHLYTEMGRHVYMEITYGRDIKKDDPYLKERVLQIGQLEMEIKDIEEEIEDIKKTLPPTHGDEIL